MRWSIRIKGPSTTPAVPRSGTEHSLLTQATGHSGRPHKINSSNSTGHSGCPHKEHPYQSPWCRTPGTAVCIGPLTLHHPDHPHSVPRPQRPWFWAVAYPHWCFHATGLAIRTRLPSSKWTLQLSSQEPTSIWTLQLSTTSGRWTAIYAQDPSATGRHSRNPFPTLQKSSPSSLPSKNPPSFATKAGADSGYPH